MKSTTILNFKKLVFGIFLITAFFSGIKKTYATHAAGADLTYTCLGGNQYRIEVTFYRDCGGVAEPTTITVRYKSASLGQNLTVTANKITGTGQEITVPCATSSSTCSGGTSIGIRKFVYQATVTLPGAATDWKFSYGVCCRNCAITSIMNPCASTTEIYVESTLNNVAAPGNSSPLFSNIPIAFVCSGQNFNYNHGVSDVNGDSLSYEFITPKINETTNVTFVPPFTATTPFSSSTPFNLNTQTGQISFTPNMVQVGIMAIRVKEYRNGVLIGSVIRDMEVFTTVCSNNLPTASGINNSGNYTMTACANQQVCFDVYSNDADAAQNVTVTTNNGIAAGTYSISSASKPVLHFCWTPTLADIDLSPNTFTVTVQDNACPNNGVQTYSYSINVVAPDFNISSNNINCFGFNNGSATAVPLYGGTQTYLWSNGATSATISNLSPGTYTATLTNSNGCTISKSVTITQPALLNSALTQTNISCAGLCDGAINVTASGGTSPYGYSWTGGSTNQSISGKCLGTYTVTVTDSKNCTTTKSATLINISNISATVTGTNVNCFGDNSGTAVLTVSGGVLPYSYQWSNGSTLKDLNSVPAGTYTVTVSDGNSCTKTAVVIITQPAAALSSNVVSSVNVSCYGGMNGAIDVSVSGGTPPYSYNWSNGNTNQDLSNTSSGSYSVTVTDAKGCTTVVSSVNITQPASPLTSNVISTTNVACYGGNNGAVSLTVSGGTTPYTYNWSNGSTSQNLSNVGAGMYSVIVTDAMGCTASNAGLQITQPGAALNSSITATSNVSCYGGSNGGINLNVTGGTTPYTFNWSNGSTLQHLINATAGIYSITITDAKGCTTMNTGLQISQPASALNSSAGTTSNVSCFGGNNGSINLSVNGGTAPYSYIWNNGSTMQNLSNISSGSYTVIVSDTKGCTTAVLGILISQPASSLNGNINSITEILCFGGSNGAINLNVSGGTVPYNFNWSNGSTAQTLVNVTAGTYSVNIIDFNGCTKSITGIMIGQPSAALSSGISHITNVSCYGNSSGDIDLSITGGTAPYAYAWNNGAISQDLNNVPAGTYAVIVTDAHGCTAEQNAINISQPAGPLNAVATTAANVNCTSGANGAISLTVNGGTPGYNYYWNTGATTQNISGLFAGTYVVTVTDNNGCSGHTSAVVSQPAGSLNSTINTSQSVSCYGGGNGAININVAGGTIPYSFQWSNGVTMQNLSGLTAGSYTVTITDANGCINVAAATVNQPSSGLSGVVSAVSDVSCFGDHTGAIDFTVNGGTGPYSYLWSNGSTDEDQGFLVSGNYTVTVTDANGCTLSNSAISIAQPGAALSTSVSGVFNVSCNGGNNGGINLSVNGGTAPYNYNWSNGSTLQNLNAVIAGIYSVTVTDAKGCTAVISGLTVQQPAAALNGSVASAVNVSCYGGNNGNIDFNVSGGTAPYSYQWNNGASTQNIYNISSGAYTVTVTDNKGCTLQVAGILITQPAASLAASPSVTANVSCFGGNNGNISLNVTGGTLPYSYQWNSGATTQNINNLISGTYTVTVTDAKGCTITAGGIAVTQPNAALAANTSSTTNVSCFGGNNGNISVAVNGGTAPYTYQWNNGGTSQNISNLGSGTYSVTVSDAKGCSTEITAIAVNQPAAPVTASATSISNVNCFGGNSGSIDLTVNGGTSPYSFLWSNGSTLQNIGSLISGNYTVMVTDINGCTEQVAGISVNQPASPLISQVSSITNVNCFGGNNGNISINVSGGSAPYSYQWSNGAVSQNLNNVASGNYDVTITDSKGCSTQITGVVIGQPGAALSANTLSTSNVSCYGGSSGAINLNVNGGTTPYSYQWSNGNTNQNINNLSSGTYTVIVTDAKGCTTQVSGIGINQPGAAVSLVPSAITSVSCYGGNNGSININVNGGTSPYFYQWSTGATTQNIVNLSTGNYTVTVTDFNGCTAQVSGMHVNQPLAVVTANVNTTTDVSCYGGNNGNINLSVNGGTIPYTFIWNNGSTSQNLTNLSAGAYTTTVTDANGCSTQVSGIMVSQPSGSLNSSPSATVNVGCFGGNTGSISLNVNGGTAPYNYLWNNGATTQNLSNIISGIYTVNITDSKGCTTVVNGILISEPAATLSVTPNSVIAVNCFGGNSGSISLNVSGGTAPYFFQWNNGAITQNIFNLSNGTYTVTVSDINGCTVQVSAITVSEPLAALSGNVITTQNVNCNSGGNGSVSLSVSGGTAPYNCLWSTGATTQNISGLYSGTYVVTVTDANGCTVSALGIVSQPAGALASTINVAQNVNCYGGNNGAIQLNVSGGTAPYLFLWSNGATTQNLTNLTSGAYSVTITDFNGCINITSAIVEQPAATLIATPSSVINSSCYGSNNGSINLLINGGTLPYTYQWSNGATTQNQINLPPGIYTATVTDANGCIAQAAGINISQPGAALSVNPSSINNVNCYGGNNGNIQLTVNGGTVPYTYLWNNGLTTQSLVNLPAGTYTATITDANGCSIQTSGIAITQPAAVLSASAASTTNVSCYGGNNGSVSITINGGTAPYSYQWSNGITTQNLINIGAGTYTATVTDANGCIANTSGITINQPAASISATPAATTNVNCYGGNNGSISLIVSGGTVPYTYQWSNGATSQNIINLSSGTYTATVTDNNGCSAGVTGIAVNQPAAAVSAVPSATANVSCYAGSNGFIALNVNGGTAPYTFLWSNGATTQNISSLISGIYTATITDANGCTAQAAGITINQPGASVTANPSATTNVNCFGGNNGSIQLTVNGGTVPYSYLWNNGATTQQVNNLVSGAYTVTVTDVNGCSTEVSGIAINEPAAAVSAIPSSTANVSCFGGNNGQIALSVNGGTAPYSYIWNNGATTQNIINLISGTYSVTVTDDNGCVTQIAAIAVSQPVAGLTANPTSTNNVSCFGGNNGGISLSINGGTSPYVYQWSNGATNQNINNLSSGTYTVIVTDAEGCTTAAAGIAINQPAAAVAASPASITNVSCYNGNNGNIQLAVIGGTAPYAYLWDNGATTQNLNNVASGIYSATVTDANGCVAQASGITINQPVAAVSASPTSTSNVSCFGGNNGNIQLAVNGGTLPYTFQWSNGATTQDIFTLQSGTYTVTVTDVNGCITQVVSININQPGAAVTATPSSTTNVSCFGGSNGDINLTVNGGTSPYIYQWNNGATTQNLSNLTSGIYSATVIDNNGCTVQVNSININQPATPLNGIVTTTQNVSCNSGGNGTIALATSGGTAPYSYLWSNGQTTQNISGLYSGSYIVTITDNNGCVFTDIGTVSQPAGALSSNINVAQNINCYGGNNGAILLNVNGGTAPYSYSWSNGSTSQNLNNLQAGTYSVSISDANGCLNVAYANVQQPSGALIGNPNSTTNVSCYGGNNGGIILSVTGGTMPYTYQWSNGEITQNLSNLSSGTYTVTVTDDNGCTAQVSGIAVSQPGASVSAVPSSTTNVSCYGGNNGDITLSVNGGTAPYTYQWNNGATSQNLTNLSSGSYTVSVTDVNGCVTQVTGIAINQPGAAVTANPTSTTNVSCYGGNNGDITLAVNGGTAPYIYQWSNGATTQNINNLVSGIYTATITDANGCSTQVSGISINQPGASVAANATSTTNVSCYGGNNGNITLSVVGGTLPYTYQWSNGETTQNITNLISGTYTATITDLNGCTTQLAGISINQPGASVSASPASTTNVSCFGGNNGDIILTVSGGTAPYTYQWNNGATTQDLYNISSGAYTVTVTDSNGCTFEIDSVMISQPPTSIAASPTSISNVSCFGGSNGYINLSATGGTTPYVYAWSNGATTQNISNLPSGTYTVMVTDANGCTTQASGLMINQPGASLSASPVSTNNVSCFGGSNGDINITVSGGTIPYNYQWSNGATTAFINNLVSASYTVTITDAMGCTTQIDSITINQPPSALTANPDSITNILCYGGSNGDITINVNGGTVPYVYQWNNGATTQNLNSIQAGNYTVTITDINGCTSQINNLIVAQPGLLNANTTFISGIDCFGGKDGEIDLTVTGGTAPYVFQWSNGATTQNNTYLPAGTYTATVTDANGCTIMAQGIVILQPAAPLTVIPSAVQNVLCFAASTGSVDITTSNGTAPYTYLWSNGLTTEDINNVPSGLYTVTVTDSHNCTTTATVMINQPSAGLSINGSVTNANCLYGISGSISININGGTAPYVYLWNTGSSSQNPGNISSGTYTVTVTDASGCTNMNSYQVTDNSSFNANAAGPTEFCSPGSVLLNADSVPAATYQWYFNGQLINGASGYSYTATDSGSYQVIVTNACGSFSSLPMNIMVHKGDSIFVSSDVIVCPGESAQLNVTGGVAYEWLPATDLNNNLLPDPIVTPTASAVYTITVTNIYGCKTTDSVMVELQCDTLIIPSGYSPNEDGVNDYFVIPGIDKYPGNKIWIYNRWGSLVYEKHDYDNKWGGISNTKGVYIGQKVPAATYFYVLDLNNNTKPRQGYIVIRY